MLQILNSASPSASVNVVSPGHAKIVHLLLERNKSGTIPSDSQGATPLHYGAQSNNAVSYTHTKERVYFVQLDYKYIKRNGWIKRTEVVT